MKKKKKAPYYLKTGDFKGMSLEALMFCQYRELRRRLEALKGFGNAQSPLKKRLEWLIQRGETRMAKMLCPICKKNPVEWFAVFHLFTDGNYQKESTFTAVKEYSCCGDEECKEQTEKCGFGAKVEIKPIKFSTIPELAKSDFEEKMLLNLFREFFGLEGSLKGKEALSFFEEK